MDQGEVPVVEAVPGGRGVKGEGDEGEEDQRLPEKGRKQLRPVGGSDGKEKPEGGKGGYPQILYPGSEEFALQCQG